MNDRPKTAPLIRKMCLPLHRARHSETAQRAIEQHCRETESHMLACLAVDRGQSWSAAEAFCIIIATLLGMCLHPCMELLEVLQNPIHTLHLVPAPE